MNDLQEERLNNAIHTWKEMSLLAIHELTKELKSLKKLVEADEKPNPSPYFKSLCSEISCDLDTLSALMDARGVSQSGDNDVVSN